MNRRCSCFYELKLHAVLGGRASYDNLEWYSARGDIKILFEDNVPLSYDRPIHCHLTGDAYCWCRPHPILITTH